MKIALHIALTYYICFPHLSIWFQDYATLNGSVNKTLFKETTKHFFNLVFTRVVNHSIVSNQLPQ